MWLEEVENITTKSNAVCAVDIACKSAVILRNVWNAF